MSELSNAKLFGGIGAILGLVGGIVPFAGPMLSIVGLILVFVAIKYIADKVKEGDIFRNYLFSFILTVIAIVVIVAGILITVGGIAFADIEDEISDFDSAVALIGGIAISLIIGWVLLIIGTTYLRKSYNKIAKHTGVSLFRTTGLLYFIGAITLIILIGAFILFIAKILEIISFFSLPEELPSDMEGVSPETE